MLLTHLLTNIDISYRVVLRLYLRSTKVVPVLPTHLLIIKDIKLLRNIWVYYGYAEGILLNNYINNICYRRICKYN